MLWFMSYINDDSYGKEASVRRLDQSSCSGKVES